MASALEMYFMGSGLFGNGVRPAIRVMHTFPLLEHAASYSKTKLQDMINSSIPALNSELNKKNNTQQSYMQALLDKSTPTNNSLHFKQFVGGNHLWIESTGIDADRLMGRTSDVMLIDECFPEEQKVYTEKGKKTIKSLYNDFKNNKKLPLIKSFNEKTEEFEFNKILNIWKKGKKPLISVIVGSRKIKCTENHLFLTDKGWKKAKDLINGNLIKSDFYNDSAKVLNKNYSYIVVNKVEKLNQIKEVYDIEVERNHNFVLATNHFLGGPIVHNCQKTPGLAIGNALKILTTAKYGKKSKGVQVFFGTPRKKGSDFHRMWQSSSQQYYYLGCEKCEKHFPLYSPESDSWKEVWIHTMIVKCTHCGFEQNKLEATERGKWIGVKNSNDPDCAMIGFHLNQLYMPMFTREDIDKEAPGKHPVNTEKTYQNEVMGEFYQGDSSPITQEEIQEYCADFTRKFSAKLSPSPDEIVVMGIDYGARADLEQMADSDKIKRQGQSFSTAVILLSKGPGLLSIEYAVKFKRNDIESKKGLIDQLYRQYGVNLMVGDIGFSQDFSELMQTSYGDKYLVSRALGKVNNNVKYKADSFPKEIDFARSFYIGELFEQMKKGMIRFPYGDYEKIGWLVDHCASMEIKPILSKTGDPTINYVKGGSPNDGFMALLNAYLAYKFILTNGFADNNPYLQKNVKPKQLILGAYMPTIFKK